MASIFTLPPEIIQTHILTRLDGPTLAITSCTSSQFRSLCNQQKLWQDICSETWNSTKNPRVSQIISTFSGGHRSFFFDSFLQLSRGRPSRFNLGRSLGTSGLISAVDIYYEDKLIFSRVEETNTTSGQFLYSPFRIDLLDPKNTVSIPMQHTGQVDTRLRRLEENLSLSWILLGQNTKRAANMSTRRPVLIRWPCGTAGVVRLHYTTIMDGDGRPGSKVEVVKCKLAVTCSGVDEGGEVKVEEVSMQMKDMEGRILNGRDSMVILREALENGTRKMSGREEVRERYEDYVKRKKERKEKKRRRERVMDVVCAPFFVCIATWLIAFFVLTIIC